MYLHYDRISKMFTLDKGEEGALFLGPWDSTMITLKRIYKLTDSQVREAMLQAVFNMGSPVDLAIIKKIASDESRFFKRNVAA